MDNRSANRGNMSVDAKAFTEEIDRATTPLNEVEKVGGDKGVAMGSSAQQLGGSAIFSTTELVGVEMEANKELARDEDQIEHAEKYVGVESELQAAERLAEDQADLQAEMGMGDPLTVKVMARSQEELSQAMMPVVNKIVNQPKFRPADLVKVYNQGAEKARGIFGRKLGERN